MQSTQEVNYKDTLNLPQTEFKMKAGAATREPEIEAFWEENKVYEKTMAARDKAHKFVLHDGPPYLSSDKIHIGTALNKILKDIVTRYKAQRGYYAPYVPGYDGHGLPIENAVVKDIKGGRNAISPAELRKRCREFGLKNLKGQEANFKRLGVWGDWGHPYLTPDAKFEATQIKLFYDMYKKGYVYKGLKPVYWSPASETALADAEVEYADHTSHSIYVAFKFKYGALAQNFIVGSSVLTSNEILNNSSFVIWTTTPWTLPANLALSVHPEFEYVVTDTKQFGKLIVAKELLKDFLEKAKIDEHRVLLTFQGKDMELWTAQHPFIDRESPVLCGTHVTLDAGTGIVHTAPGHGMEDYVICQQYNREHPYFKANPLPILSPLNGKGVFTAEAGPQLEGVFYEKGNDVVLEMLREKNALLAHSKFTHSYPHDWRTHTPVIYRATEQWFINVDGFRKEALEAIRTVGWIPAKGESRITAMVEGRGDWCISRQRVWGVPIPVFYYQDTNEVLINDTLIEHVYQLFCEHSSDIWWEQSAEELLAGLPESEKQAIGLGTRPLIKEMDIMDVWFDSGVTHTAVVEDRHEELGHLPVELYLEGSDQHRGWFQSSLLTSVMLYGKAPYKSVLTHGFVLDQDGRKMSKSLGNVVDPNSVIQQYGADILRLWIASVDYTTDIRIGNTILAQLAETYKKVRNTFRFMLGNLADFNPLTDKVGVEQLSTLDKYTLHRLQGLVERVTGDFDKYEFHRYNHEIQYFCGTDLSAIYFDVAKDILYCDAKNAPRRRAVQTVIYETLMTLLPMLVPVMPHLADDIWLNLPEAQKAAYPELVSITMAPWPSVNPVYQNDTVAAEFEQLLKLKETVNLAMEQPRSEGKIGSSLDAAVWIQSTQPVVTGRSEDELSAFLISSGVTLSNDAPPADRVLARQESAGQWTVSVLSPNAEKCQRCWKYLPSVGQNSQHPVLCARCAEAVTA